MYPICIGRPRLNQDAMAQGPAHERATGGTPGSCRSTRSSGIRERSRPDEYLCDVLTADAEVNGDVDALVTAIVSARQALEPPPLIRRPLMKSMPLAKFLRGEPTKR